MKLSVVLDDYMEDTFMFDDDVLVMHDGECTTQEGEAGQCLSLRRCHPILFSDDGEVRNSDLALTYAQIGGFCSSKDVSDEKNDVLGEFFSRKVGTQNYYLMGHKKLKLINNCVN